jgi:hypothetical protein
MINYENENQAFFMSSIVSSIILHGEIQVTILILTIFLIKCKEPNFMLQCFNA